LLGASGSVIVHCGAAPDAEPGRAQRRGPCAAAAARRAPAVGGGGPMPARVGARLGGPVGAGHAARPAAAGRRRRRRRRRTVVEDAAAPVPAGPSCHLATAASSPLAPSRQLDRLRRLGLLELLPEAAFLRLLQGAAAAPTHTPSQCRCCRRCWLMRPRALALLAVLPVPHAPHPRARASAARGREQCCRMLSPRQWRPQAPRPRPHPRPLRVLHLSAHRPTCVEAVRSSQDAACASTPERTGCPPPSPHSRLHPQPTPRYGALSSLAPCEPTTSLGPQLHPPRAASHTHTSLRWGRQDRWRADSFRGADPAIPFHTTRCAHSLGRMHARDTEIRLASRAVPYVTGRGTCRLVRVRTEWQCEHWWQPAGPVLRGARRRRAPVQTARRPQP
jgi:hypothetical protein